MAAAAGAAVFSGSASTPFGPATFFASGEEGFWYDPSDFTTMFQDTAATVPVTAAGQTVARINDKSGRGNHATQASAGQRPTLRQHGTTLKYYLEFDGVDDNLTTTVAFGSVQVLSVFAGLRNRTQIDLAGLLEMTSASSTTCVRQRAVGGNTIWDALLSGTTGEGSSCNATSNTTAPNDMVMSSQHDIPNDLSTARVNAVAGANAVGDKSTGTLGTVTVNIGKMNFRTGVAADLYGIIVRGALTATPTDAEYWLDTAMGGGVMPPFSEPEPPMAAKQGFARELDGRFPWVVHGQPESQFTFWSDVGVNVLDSWNPDVSGVSGYDYANMASFNSSHIAAAEAWDSAAISAGFKFARHPYTAARALADLEAVMREHIVGWSAQDEPEAGSGFDIAPQLAMMDAADPTFTIPRRINFTGPAVIFQQASVLFPYFNQFADYPAVQAGFDLYPVQQTTAGKTVILGYRPNGQPYTATHSSLGLVSSRTEQWPISGTPTDNPLATSPYAVFIATAGFVEGYQTELRIPTPEQVRFQIADAIVMGAEAISFFPQRFEWITGAKTFTSHNATPGTVKTALTSIIARWQALETGFAANLLIDPATNRIWPTAYRVCPDTVPSGQQDTAESGLTFASPPTSAYLPGPFQGSKRVTSIGNVYFIQNMMDEAASLTDATWGFSAVSFAARETLVFLEADRANAVWSDIDGAP
ncbi:hypothetical protein [Novosphingobium sp.]|uniref:hypothetical protein n=1 Tax=Novosphingobium sp. TaxID=1874826 RepID=UPI00286D971F|nr:hypothetical protein [Novosphingobium sp.]